VALEAGGLSLDGTESVLTPDLLDLAREHRAGLLAFLSAPCPCGPCREPGAEPHGPQCYCGPCLDTDPTWQAWRREADREGIACRPGCSCAECAAGRMPARWTAPGLGAEERALLEACRRLDRASAAAPRPEGPPCPRCASPRWRTRYVDGCWGCSPPPQGARLLVWEEIP
jgi:hypothetical protein